MPPWSACASVLSGQGLFTGPGSFMLVPYGVRLAYKLPEARMKLTFACMLLVIMILLQFGS